MRQRIYGPEHPDVAQSMESLAVLYMQTSRTDEGKQLLAKAGKIRRAGRLR